MEESVPEAPDMSLAEATPAPKEKMPRVKAAKPRTGKLFHATRFAHEPLRQIERRLPRR